MRSRLQRLRYLARVHLVVMLFVSSAAIGSAQQAAAASVDAAGVTPIEAGQQTPSGQATITGSVLDTAGALVQGATIQVLDARGGVLQEVTSGSDGQFRVEGLPAGELTVRVSLQGFEPASALVDVAAGQSHALKPFAVRMADAQVEVDVRAPAQATAEDEIQVEETQRLFGFLPNFYVSYDWNSPPLNVGEKFRLAGKDMRDPGNLLLVGTVAGVQQATNSFPGYGQGAVGYGKRYGADYANLEVGTLLGEAVLPALLHQDPRYFYKGTGGVRSRVLYALSFAVVRRGDNGRRQFATAGVLGDLSAGAVSNLYYPASSRHGAELTFENGLLGIAGDALNGLFQEFFARKVTPHAVGKNSNP